MLSKKEVIFLSKKFNIRMKKYVHIQAGVFKVIDQHGRSYCLKRMPLPLPQLKWIDRTLTHLKNVHPFHIAWRLNCSKRLYFQWNADTPPYIMTHWMKGKWPSVYSPSQIKASGALLAKFHLIGKKINIPVHGKVNMGGSMPAYLNAELRKLQDMIARKSQSSSNAPFILQLKRNGNELLNNAKSSIQSLNKTRYASLSRRNAVILCHGDFGPTNIMLSKSGMALIDFETLRMDLRASDLARALFNFCQLRGWNFDVARHFLDGYCRYSTITKSELEIIASILRFPRGIWKLIQHYDRNTPVVKRTIEKQFPLFLRYERKKDAFLKSLISYGKKSI